MNDFSSQTFYAINENQLYLNTLSTKKTHFTIDVWENILFLKYEANLLIICNTTIKKKKKKTHNINT